MALATTRHYRPARLGRASESMMVSNRWLSLRFTTGYRPAAPAVREERGGRQENEVIKNKGEALAPP